MMTRETKHKQAWISAAWPAPSWVRAGTTTRQSGFSKPPFAGLNLALHVEDNTEAVLRNRSELVQRLGLPGAPLWLSQVHGNQVIGARNIADNTRADGSYTDEQGIVCAVLTADCVPLLLCNQAGTRVAAIHAGWRGLCAGVIEQAIHVFDDDRSGILAWIGPHIHAANYEVGTEVRNACIHSLPASAKDAFSATTRGHWYANLEQLTRLALKKEGVTEIFSCERCTYDETDYFYSYRRNRHTGRMASLIWLQNR